ncbi:NAD(P)/FAD-dependent oxidoreductase [Mycolicibacterium mucogenicum]|uniref:NAD(P)/FAD-dependent oxidoreductase n=1 Tax=Mycolicibacterium mucogenicum TaxID=56689 RepID=UPI0009F389CC|nr:FAD-dependent oxidoreductase [Mycolicibacterium mucogenicum]
MSDSRVVIIGGGQGGAILASSLRTYGHTGDITIICAEAVLPYERPPLSKGVLGGDVLTPVVPESFYADNRVDVLLDTRATTLTKNAHGWCVGTGRGHTLPADVVVIATGSTPRRLNVPGRDLPYVTTLGNIADAATIRDRLPDTQRVVIAGGGFIGSEVAAVLRAQGRDVIVIDPVALPIANRTAPWVAQRLHERHLQAGVEIVQDTIESIRGSDGVEQVVTKGGRTVDCDLVLVAIGSDPNQEIAAESGLRCGNGIVCDQYGHASRSGVYAIGDVASWPYEGLGRLRIEHFRTAGDHAQAVASTIVGRGLPPLRAPWFWTDQYEHRVEVAGSPQLGDEVIIRNGQDGRPYLSLHLREGRAVGAVSLDAPREMRTAARMIEKQSAVDSAAVANSSIDLRKAELIP